MSDLKSKLDVLYGASIHLNTPRYSLVLVNPFNLVAKCEIVALGRALDLDWRRAISHGQEAANFGKSIILEGEADLILPLARYANEEIKKHGHHNLLAKGIKFTCLQISR